MHTHGVSNYCVNKDEIITAIFSVLCFVVVLISFLILNLISRIAFRGDLAAYQADANET